MAKMTGGMLMSPLSRDPDVLAAGLLTVLRGGSEETGGLEDLEDWELYDLTNVLVRYMDGLTAGSLGFGRFGCSAAVVFVLFTPVE